MRTKTIVKLGYEMRYAENYYQETGKDNKKHLVVEKLNKLQPTEREKEFFEHFCNSMGV
jgi:hypothetical protein